MSISLTIYDLFANLIPGLLYLYVINETLITFNQRAIDLAQLDHLPNLILVGMAAFVCGHLANSITYRYWYRIFVKKYADREGLLTVSQRNQVADVRFKPIDSRTLIGVIRHHTPDLANTIELHQANSIMMRNISLGAALFTLLQIILTFRTQEWGYYGVLAGLGVLAVVTALNRAYKFDYWYNRNIFYEALNYGKSLEEVLEISRAITAQNSAHPSTKSSKKPERQAARE